MTDDGIELVRCTRGHTVKRGDCTHLLGHLVCPVCECRVPTDDDPDPEGSR